MTVGKIKQLAFSEGTTVANPSEIYAAAAGLAQYASTAAFVSAEGTATEGDAFYDTTDDVIKYYDGSAWQKVAKLDSPTLLTPTIDDYLQINEESAPSTPSSGKVRVYAKTDKKLYLKDSAGTETQVGAGGSGELNLITNPSDSNNWSSTGWSNAVATTTTAGDLPLSGIVSTAIQITSDTSAGAESSEYVSYSFTTPAGLATKLKVEFYMRPGTNFIAREWTVSVYQSTTRQSLSTDSSSVTYLPNTTGKFTTTFDAAASTAYTLRFARPVNAGANAGVLNVANVIVGPGIQPQGAAVSGWTSFTPTWTNITVGNGTQEGYWRRVGDTIEVRATINFGSSTSVGGSISPILPNSLSRVSPSSLNLVIGSFVAYDASATTFFTGAVQNQTGGIFLVSDDDTTANAVNATVPFTWSGATSDILRIEYSVGIAEWAGSGTLNVSANDVEYASVGGTWDADSSTTVYGPGGSLLGGALAASRTKTITWQTPVQASDRIQFWGSKDQINWFPLIGAQLGASNNFVSPPALDSTGSGLSGVTWRPGASSNQTIVTFLRYMHAANDDSPTVDWPSSAAYWVATKSSGGQAVGFGNVAQSSSGLVKSAGQLLGTNTNDSAATGYVGEYLSTTLTYASRNGLATNTTENVTGSAITLTAGDWDVQGVVAFEASAATITNLSAAVSLTPATLPSTSTLAVPTSGEIYLAQAMNTSVSGVGGVLTIPTYRVSVSSSTPLYLVARAIFSAGTVDCYGHLSARRVR